MRVPRRSRKATVADVHEIARAMPHVTDAGRPGRPVYQVGGKSFIFFRTARPDAVDPETGERMEDVLVFWVADLGDKDALVQADGPFFTTPHWNGYKGVLLRERDLGQVSHRELEEVVTDAWLARAPKRLAQEFLARSEEPS